MYTPDISIYLMLADENKDLKQENDKLKQQNKILKTYFMELISKFESTPLDKNGTHKLTVDSTLLKEVKQLMLESEV